MADRNPYAELDAARKALAVEKKRADDAERRLKAGDPLPPHDRAAERAILSAILTGTATLVDALLLVSPQDFYVYGHALIFRAMMRLEEQGKPLDIVMLVDALRARTELDDAGGPAYVTELWDTRYGNAILHHAAIVREFAVRRALIAIGAKLMTDASTLTIPIMGIRRRVGESLDAIRFPPSPTTTRS